MRLLVFPFRVAELLVAAEAKAYRMVSVLFHCCYSITAISIAVIPIAAIPIAAIPIAAVPIAAILIAVIQAGEALASPLSAHGEACTASASMSSRSARMHKSRFSTASAYFLHLRVKRVKQRAVSRQRLAGNG